VPTLAEALLRKESTMATVVAYIQQYLDEHWQAVWHAHLPEIERVYAKSGDSAYAVYSRALFLPLEDELSQAGLSCRPRFPGTFSASWEQGPWEERDRRVWCVLHQGDGAALGTLVTRLFHDHTQLRIPRSPAVLALEETDHAAIAQAIRDIQ
jgi:Family of unknown function (DUF6022)